MKPWLGLRRLFGTRGASLASSNCKHRWRHPRGAQGPINVGDGVNGSFANALLTGLSEHRRGGTQVLLRHRLARVRLLRPPEGPRSTCRIPGSGRASAPRGLPIAERSRRICRGQGRVGLCGRNPRRLADVRRLLAGPLIVVALGTLCEDNGEATAA